jgi:hypothetical protein
MPGARLGRHSHPPGAGPRPAELPAGADAELGEYLAQVPLDRARTPQSVAAQPGQAMDWAGYGFT